MIAAVMLSHFDNSAVIHCSYCSWGLVQIQKKIQVIEDSFTVYKAEICNNIFSLFMFFSNFLSTSQKVGSSSSSGGMSVGFTSSTATRRMMRPPMVRRTKTRKNGILSWGQLLFVCMERMIISTIYSKIALCSPQVKDVLGTYDICMLMRITYLSH